MESNKKVSQVCSLDLLHLQRVPFSSVSLKGNDSQTKRNMERSYFRWFTNKSHKQSSQNYLLASLYSSDHPFYFRASYAVSREEETLVVTANFSKDPCHVVKLSKVSQSSSEVWNPEWPEAKDLQVGLICLLAENGKLLVLIDPCSLLLRIYSLEGRELCCCLTANDIQWKQGIVVAASLVYSGGTLSILLLSDALQVYCISLDSENCGKGRKFSTNFASLKIKHKTLRGATFCVYEDNQVILALVLDRSIILVKLILSPEKDENNLSSFSIMTRIFEAEFIFPQEIYNVIELWVTHSPRVLVARDTFQKTAYVWHWNNESNWSNNMKVDSRRKQYKPKVVIENCECLISLEQHNICYLDSETRSFRWMNEDFIALYMELGQGDVPVFSVVATLAANSAVDVKSSLCKFAFVELTTKDAPSLDKELGYALEWRGWTLEKSTPENAFNNAIKGRDYELALSISHFHKLVDDDSVIALWRISDGDADAARSLIQNIRDPNLIVDECCQGFASSPAALKLLLRRAMEVLEDRPSTLRIEEVEKKRHKLELWSSLLKLYQDEGLCNLLELNEFFSYRIPAFLERIACLGQTDIIYRFLKTEPILESCFHDTVSVFDDLWSIIECIPEVIPPRTYAPLLEFVMRHLVQLEKNPTRLAKCVRDRAFQIEKRGCDFDNVSQWMEIFNEGILGNLLWKDRHRFEELMSALKEEAAPTNISLSTYCDHMDMEQEILFILFHDTRPRESILQDLSEDCVEYFRQRLYGNTLRLFVKNRLEEDSETKDILQRLFYDFLSYAVERTGPIGIHFLATFLQFSPIFNDIIFSALFPESAISDNVLLEQNRTNAQFALKVAYEKTCREPLLTKDLSPNCFDIVRSEDPRHWECDWDIEIIDSLGVLYEALPTRVPNQMETQIRMFEDHLIILDYLWKYDAKYSLQFLLNVTGENPNSEALELLKDNLKNIPLKEIEEVSFYLDEITLTQKMQSCYESLMDICRRLPFLDSEKPLYWICEALLVSEAPFDVCFKFLVLLREEEQERLVSNHITRKLRHESIAEARKWISSWLQHISNDQFSESRESQTKYYQQLFNLCDVHDLLNDSFGLVTYDLLSLVSDEEMKKNVLFQAADSIFAQTNKLKSLEHIEQQMIRLGSLLGLPKEMSQLALATGSFKQGKMEWTSKLLRVLIERKYEGCWELCNAIVSSYLSMRVIPEGITTSDLRVMAYFACCHCPEEELVTWSEHLEEYIDNEFSSRQSNQHAQAMSSTSREKKELQNSSWSCIFYETDFDQVGYDSLEQLGPYDGRVDIPNFVMKKANSDILDIYGRDLEIVNTFVSIVQEFLEKGLAGAATSLSILSKISALSTDETWNIIIEQILDTPLDSSLKVGKGLIAFAVLYRYLCFIKQDISFRNLLENFSIDDWCHLRFADVMTTSSEELQTAKDLWNGFVEEWDSYQVWKATFAPNKLNNEKNSDSSLTQETQTAAILKLCESTSLDDAQQIVSRAIKFGVSECRCCTELLRNAIKRYCMNPEKSLELSIFNFVENYKDVLVRQEDELGWDQSFDSFLQQIPGDNYGALKVLYRIGAMLYVHMGQSSKEDWCLKRYMQLEVLEGFFNKFAANYKAKLNFKNLIATDEQSCQQEWLSFMEGLDYNVSREEESKLLDELCCFANQLHATLDSTPSSSWMKVAWVRLKLQHICDHTESPLIKLEEELYEKVSLLQTCELQDLVPFIRVGLRSLKMKPGISVRLDMVIWAYQTFSQTQEATADQNSKYSYHWQQLLDERSTLETIARISEWLWLERTDLAEYLFQELDRGDMDYSLSKRVFINFLKNAEKVQLSVDSIYRGITCLDSNWLTCSGVDSEELFMEIFSSAVDELLNDLTLSEQQKHQREEWACHKIGRCKHILSILSKSLMQQKHNFGQDPIISSSPSTAWEESLLPNEESGGAQQNILLYRKTLEKCLEIVRSWVQNLRQTVAESDFVYLHRLILELMEFVIQIEQLHDLEKVENDSQQWKWWKLMNEMTDMFSLQESSDGNSLLQVVSSLDKSIVENEMKASDTIMEELFPLCRTVHDYRVLNAFIITLDSVGNFTAKEQSQYRKVVLLWLEKLIQFYCQETTNGIDSRLITCLTQHLGNFARMGWEEAPVQRMLSSLFEKRPLLACLLGVVSGYPSICNFYTSQLERIATHEPVDLSIIPLVKTWVLEDTSKRLIVVGRSWLFAALVPSLLEEKEESLESILGSLVDSGLVEQAGLLCMEKEAIHPAFRNQHSAIAFIKRYWTARLKEISKESTLSSSERRKHLLRRLKYLEQYSK